MVVNHSCAILDLKLGREMRKELEELWETGQELGLQGIHQIDVKMLRYDYLSIDNGQLTLSDATRK